MKPETKAIADGIIDAVKSQVESIRKEVDKRFAELPVPRDGKDGEKGADGLKGDPGDKGPAGDKGEKGEPGRDGKDGSMAEFPSEQFSKMFEETLNA